MKHFTAALLALLLVLPLLVSCGSKNDTPAATTAAAPGSAADTAATEPPETEVHDDVPDLDYKGETVTFFYRTNCQNEYFSEELNGEVVNDAIYERNAGVCERLNVKFEFVGEQGDYSTRKTYADKVTQSVTAGSAAYDIVSSYSMAGANLAFAKVVRNLYDNKYIDLEKPWWPVSLIEETTVNGFLPFVSGDISRNMITELMAIYFNKQFIDDYKLQDPYELVREGKWTIDQMFTMSKGVYVDVNGDGKKGQEDKYGFTTNHVWNDSFYWGCGLVTIDKDKASGKLVLSPQFSGEKTHKLIETLCSYYYTGNDNLFVPDDSSWLYDIFKEERALFLQTTVSKVISLFRDVTFSYGILPIPKYDEDQERHITNMSFGYSLYTIPIDIDDAGAERAGAVMECLASAGYKLVSPALFETALKVKYAADPDTAEMYDIIRAGASFDIGRVFTDSFGGKTYSLFRNAVKNNTTDWASTFESNKSSLETTLTQLNDIYAGK